MKKSYYVTNFFSEKNRNFFPIELQIRVSHALSLILTSLGSFGSSAVLLLRQLVPGPQHVDGLEHAQVLRQLAAAVDPVDVAEPATAPVQGGIDLGRGRADLAAQGVVVLVVVVVVLLSVA